MSKQEDIAVYCPRCGVYMGIYYKEDIRVVGMPKHDC